MSNLRIIIIIIKLHHYKLSYHHMITFEHILSYNNLIQSYESMIKYTSSVKIKIQNLLLLKLLLIH
jgi:hypothetical protein